MSDILKALDQVLEERKQADAGSSYVASLYHKGLNKILEKVGEESTEFIIAAKDAQTSGDNSDMVYEVADLWFHSLIALHAQGVSSTDILKELERRFDLSGLVEKQQRQQQD